MYLKCIFNYMNIPASSEGFIKNPHYLLARRYRKELKKNPLVVICNCDVQIKRNLQFQGRE